MLYSWWNRLYWKKAIEGNFKTKSQWIWKVLIWKDAHLACNEKFFFASEKILFSKLSETVLHGPFELHWKGGNQTPIAIKLCSVTASTLASMPPADSWLRSNGAGCSESLQQSREPISDTWQGTLEINYKVIFPFYILHSVMYMFWRRQASPFPFLIPLLIAPWLYSGIRQQNKALWEVRLRPREESWLTAPLCSWVVNGSSQNRNTA